MSAAAMKRFSVVSTELPSAPYPESTKANGYRPEIDWQRIKASKTWRLCAADQRNNLLRLWMESWNEVPAGSWENDDEIIAAAIDMPVRLFQAHRDQLMRGWYLAADGRLYHAVIAEMVLGMIVKRRGSAERVKKYRDKRIQQDTNDVTRYQPVSNAQEQEQEQEQEQDKDNSEQVGDVYAPVAEKAAHSRTLRKQSRAADLDLSILPADLSPDIWRDFVRHRQSLRKPLSTQTALKSIATELEKGRDLGLTPDVMLTEAISAGWQGVKADWVRNRLDSGTGGNGVARASPTKAASVSEKNRSALDEWLAERNGRHDPGQSSATVLEGEFVRD